MSVDLTRLRQMFLIALQSSQDGEALAALRKATSVAKAGGIDAHALADRLTQQAPSGGSNFGEQMLRSQLAAVSNQLANTQNELVLLRAENARLKAQAGATPQQPSYREPHGELQWRRMAQQLLANASITEREFDFLSSILSSGWATLTDRQERWLNDIWLKYVGPRRP